MRSEVQLLLDPPVSPFLHDRIGRLTCLVIRPVRSQDGPMARKRHSHRSESNTRDAVGRSPSGAGAGRGPSGHPCDDSSLSKSKTLTATPDRPLAGRDRSRDMSCRGQSQGQRLPTSKPRLTGCRLQATRKRARLLLDRIKRDKGVWWMPWQQEAMKDVALCDKPGGGESTL